MTNAGHDVKKISVQRVVKVRYRARRAITPGAFPRPAHTPAVEHPNCEAQSVELPRRSRSAASPPAHPPNSSAWCSAELRAAIPCDRCQRRVRAARRKARGKNRPPEVAHPRARGKPSAAAGIAREARLKGRPPKSAFLQSLQGSAKNHRRFSPRESRRPRAL